MATLISANEICTYFLRNNQLCQDGSIGLCVLTHSTVCTCGTPTTLDFDAEPQETLIRTTATQLRTAKMNGTHNDDDIHFFTAEEPMSVNSVGKNSVG